ncbi:MAG: hypothetical protein PVJ38_03620, partial [Candidatus Bathyarchaeota archaeon]
MVSLALMVVSVVIAIVAAQRLMGMSDVSLSDDGLEILNISCVKDGHMNWRVTIYVFNPGDSCRSLSNVLVNGMEVSEYGEDGPDTVSSSITTSMEKNTLVQGGETAVFYVWI